MEFKRGLGILKIVNSYLRTGAEGLRPPPKEKLGKSCRLKTLNWGLPETVTMVKDKVKIGNTNSFMVKPPEGLF